MRSIANSIILLILVVSCVSPKSKNIKQITDRDDLVAFQKTRNNINIDTLQFEIKGTILHYAIRQGADSISKQLIDDNYNLNATDSLNFTPLLAASMDANTFIINELLKHPININTIEDFNGYSALHYAIYHDNLDLVKKLVFKKANINLKSKSVMTYTPLHLAISKGHIDIVDFLMKKKAIDTIQDVNDDTAVDLALRSSNSKIKMLFYPKMSKEDKESLFFHTARHSKDTSLLKKLITENKFSKALISQALIFSKDTTMSKLLLNKGARISYKHPNYDYGPIHHAAIRGDVNMLGFLIKHGANVNQLSKKSQTSPLMHAARLYRDFNLTNRDIGGMQISINAMFYDVMGSSEDKNRENSLKAVKFLIDNNANINFKNNDNENVLYSSESTLNDDLTAYLKSIGVKTTKLYSEMERKKQLRERASRNF